MMPFREDFDVIRRSIREAASRAKVECIWADEIIEAGPITEQIVNEIRRSWACIADVTGQNPNVAWEIGFAQALGKPVVAIAQSAMDLFFDLKDQRTIVYSREDLPRTLVQHLTIWLERLRSSQPSVPPEDLVGTTRHENTTLVLGAKRIADTPYGFFDLIARAKDHLFLAAQNHFYFAERPERGEQLRSELTRFLGVSKSRRVDIMLCDETADFAIQAWQYVTAERYAKDLHVAAAFFQELAIWANGNPDIAGRVTIRQVPFVPMSITFVDPLLREGFLVLTPNGYEERNIVRPCFVISRSKNDDIFQQYWSAYYQRFNDPLGATKK
jgi:hypothetical protein